MCRCQPGICFFTVHPAFLIPASSTPESHALPSLIPPSFHTGGLRGDSEWDSGAEEGRNKSGSGSKIKRVNQAAGKGKITN